MRSSFGQAFSSYGQHTTKSHGSISRSMTSSGAVSS